jgi:hypothetical protein
MAPRLLPLLAAAAVSFASACTTDLDCSLNGVCSPSSSACVCDAPWTGDSCSRLGYATATPKSGFNIYNDSDPHNTWGGPIVGPDDQGKYHAFIPYYEVGSLWKVLAILHGLGESPTGPWDWAALPNLTDKININPAFLAFPDPATGATVYSLWVDDVVHTSTSLYGNFSVLSNFSYPGVNPAPVRAADGTFYFTNQHTQQIFKTPSIAPGSTWTLVANITSLPSPAPYHIEDPFLWIDVRGNFHIINHAYSLSQFSGCGASNVSSHFFSTDAVNWHWSDQPYTHTVTYDDGTSHIFATLERPNIHFDLKTGRMTHIAFAADLETGDAGCGPKTACANCKYHVHDGTTVVALVSGA